MANSYYNTQIRNLKQPKSGQGVKPLPAGPLQDSLNIRTAAWPGLPGPAQPRDRSNGVPEEKVYAQAMGLRGGRDDEADERKKS